MAAYFNHNLEARKRFRALCGYCIGCGVYKDYLEAFAVHPDRRGWGMALDADGRCSKCWRKFVRDSAKITP